MGHPVELREEKIPPVQVIQKDSQRCSCCKILPQFLFQGSIKSFHNTSFLFTPYNASSVRRNVSFRLVKKNTFKCCYYVYLLLQGKENHVVLYCSEQRWVMTIFLFVQACLYFIFETLARFQCISE